MTTAVHRQEEAQRLRALKSASCRTPTSSIDRFVESDTGSNLAQVNASPGNVTEYRKYCLRASLFKETSFWGGFTG